MTVLAAMAGLGFNFDANQIAPDAGALGPVPAGWYSALVEESSIESTKDGTGTYIKMKLKIIEPQQFMNRVIFQNFNIKNNNQQAVDIAMGQLSALSHAVGVLNWQDTQELHQRPMKIRVKVRPAQGEYEAQNAITAFKPATENVALGPVDSAQAGVPVHPSSQQPSGAPQIGAPQVQQPMQQQQWNQQPQQVQQPQQMQQPVQQPMQQAPVQQPQQAVQQPWEQQQQPMQQQQPVQYQQQAQPQQQPMQQQPVQQAPVQQQAQPVQQQQQPQQAGAAVPPWVNQQQ